MIYTIATGKKKKALNSKNVPLIIQGVIQGCSGSSVKYLAGTESCIYQK